VTGRRAACLVGLLAWLLGGVPARAIERTVGGRPLEVTGWLELREIIRADRSSPNELALEQLWLRGRYRVLGALALETTLNTQHGGPATEQTNGGMYSYRAVFQSVSPSVQFESAFADLTLGPVDVRAGLQKFAWGKLDRVQPTDVLTPERYSDPFLLDEDERKIAIPAVQASYYLPRRDWIPEESRLTLIWIPQYIPYRFPLLGERWFPPAAVIQSSFPIAGLGSIPVGERLVNASPPSFRLDNSGYAARVSGFAKGVDYSLCYYHGFDRVPAFSLTAEALSDPSLQNLRAETRLAPVFRTINLAGGDAAYAWNAFTVRFEAAFVDGRPFSRDIRNLTTPGQLQPQIPGIVQQLQLGHSPQPVKLPQSFAVRDAVLWGLGVDYTWNGYLILVQVNQTDVLHNDVPLLIKDVDTVLVGNLRKSFLNDDLTTQLIAVQALESGYTLLMPRVTYQLWEHLEARAGYLFIAGRSNSTVGQYKDNGEAFFWIRYLI